MPPSPICPDCGQSSQIKFRCNVFSSGWNQLVEEAAGIAYGLIHQRSGPFDQIPAAEILSAPEENFQRNGFTGLFLKGQIRMHRSLENNPGKTIRIVIHEMLHSSLAGFPLDDPFYFEGFVEHATQVVAAENVWGTYKDVVLQDVSEWFSFRMKQALTYRCDYDAKRWAGWVFAREAYGDRILSMFKEAKKSGKRSWWLPAQGEKQQCAGPYGSAPIAAVASVVPAFLDQGWRRT